MILAELQATGQRQTEMQTALTCWMREGKESLAHLQRGQTALETQMLQQTSAMREGKNSLAELQQRLEKMEGQMQQQEEAMDDLQDVLEERLFVTHAVEQEGVTADNFISRSRKIKIVRWVTCRLSNGSVGSWSTFTQSIFMSI